MTNFFHKNGVIWPTINAIENSYKIGLSLDPDDLKQISDGFARFSKGHMKECIMAIDGWVCKTLQPNAIDVGGNVSAYRNRKSCWGIVVLAGCDADCKFSMFSANYSGSTNDCLAWDMCAMKHDGLIPSQYYFIGDGAFSNTAQFLVPWSGTGLGPWKDSFNFHLSSMR